MTKKSYNINVKEKEISITITSDQLGIIKDIINAEYNNIVALSGMSKKVRQAPAYKELKKLNEKFVEFA